MIPCDDDLTQDMVRYEEARKFRRMQEVFAAVHLSVTVTLASLAGPTIGTYACASLWLAFAEAARRAVRRFGDAQHMGEATELAKSGPFWLVAAYALTWVTFSHMFIRGGALSGGFSAPFAYTFTAVSLAYAGATTWVGPGQVPRADLTTAVLWIILAFPPHATAPSTAPFVVVAAKTLGVMLLQFALTARDEGRYSAARWTQMTRQASVRVTSVAANTAAFRLGQTAWVLHAHPPVFLLSAFAVLAANEWRATRGWANVGAVSPGGNIPSAGAASG